MSCRQPRPRHRLSRHRCACLKASALPRADPQHRGSSAAAAAAAEQMQAVQRQRAPGGRWLRRWQPRQVKRAHLPAAPAAGSAPPSHSRHRVGWKLAQPCQRGQQVSSTAARIHRQANCMGAGTAHCTRTPRRRLQCCSPCSCSSSSSQALAALAVARCWLLASEASRRRWRPRHSMSPCPHAGRWRQQPPALLHWLAAAAACSTAPGAVLGGGAARSTRPPARWRRRLAWTSRRPGRRTGCRAARRACIALRATTFSAASRRSPPPCPAS